MDTTTFQALKRVIKNGRWNELEMAGDLFLVETWLDNHATDHGDILLEEIKNQ